MRILHSKNGCGFAGTHGTQNLCLIEVLILFLVSAQKDVIGKGNDLADSNSRRCSCNLRPW